MGETHLVGEKQAFSLGSRSIVCLTDIHVAVSREELEVGAQSSVRGPYGTYKLGYQPVCRLYLNHDIGCYLQDKECGQRRGPKTEPWDTPKFKVRREKPAKETSEFWHLALRM